MYARSSTAIRAAVLLTTFATACNDSPLAPRNEPSPSATAEARKSGVEVFAGRAADSVVHAFDATWARASHTDFRPVRQAWRKANGLPDSVGDPGFAPVLIVPNADLVYGGGSVQSPPQVLSHYEAFHFGHHDQSGAAPDGIEANVTFIGDQAEISVASIVVTKNNGSSYSTSASVTKGAGVLVACTDVNLGNCSNRKLLNGVMTLPLAPICDASATGTVNYYVSNINSPLSSSVGVFSPGSSSDQTGTGTASAGVSSTAPACPAATADSASTTAPTGPVGVPSAPPPPPSGPNAPSAPPVSYPPTTGTTVSFHCEQGDIYENGMLFETKITCYPD